MSKINKRKINFENIISKTGATLEVIDVDNLVDAEFVKKLRRSLDMTQKVFSNMLGVSVKTIEKWEQGTNRITGGNSRLLYLIESDSTLINQYYKFESSKMKQTQVKENSLVLNLSEKHIKFKDDSKKVFSFDDLISDIKSMTIQNFNIDTITYNYCQEKQIDTKDIFGNYIS